MPVVFRSSLAMDVEGVMQILREKWLLQVFRLKLDLFFLLIAKNANIFRIAELFWVWKDPKRVENMSICHQVDIKNETLLTCFNSH